MVSKTRKGLVLLTRKGLVGFENPKGFGSVNPKGYDYFLNLDVFGGLAALSLSIWIFYKYVLPITTKKN
jgi:hypothetical protein